jgi:hypothetical protein
VSRAGLNTALIAVDATDESLARFDADPARFLRSFDLTSDERSALERWDYARLYALGAHPFILFQAVRSLGEVRGRPVPEIVAEYRAAVEPLGYPDFTT